MLGHVLRDDSFLKSILEGKIEGKRGMTRHRQSYLDQIKLKRNRNSRYWCWTIPWLAIIPPARARILVRPNISSMLLINEFS